MAPAAVLLLCSLLYAAVVAIGDAPLAVLPALLIATAVYGVVAWNRTRHVGRQH